MQKKPVSGRTGGTRTSTVTSATVKKALTRGADGLGPEEEKALRMLHGVGAPRTLVLERVGQDHPDAREKLLGIELELLRQWRQRQAARPDPRAEAKSASNPRRDKLVSALKAKKPSR